eukprot:8764701-Pyramimonas_sp.AAC.1
MITSGLNVRTACRQRPNGAAPLARRGRTRRSCRPAARRTLRKGALAQKCCRCLRSPRGCGC